jgi:hypothetical protein
MTRILPVGLMIVILSITGCAHFSITDTNKLYKGMNVASVLQVVSKGPVDEFDITSPSDPSIVFHVLHFDMHQGGISGDYYLVFKDSKLMYWGYPYEFNRYPDPIYNELGAAVVKRNDD